MTVEITKEKFCAFVDEIEKYYRKLEEIETISKMDFTDSFIFSFPGIVCDFLADLFYIPSTSPYWMNDIDYYMWELNFGKKWKPGSLTIDGKDIPLRNSEDLWNILTLGENDET